MDVEFYEKEVKGKTKTATKLHIKKIIHREIKVMQPQEVITRTATEQDKVEFKAEYAAFKASKDKQKSKTK